jgi:hypothetical protein
VPCIQEAGPLTEFEVLRWIEQVTVGGMGIGSNPPDSLASCGCAGIRAEEIRCWR